MKATQIKQHEKVHNIALGLQQLYFRPKKEDPEIIAFYEGSGEEILKVVVNSFLCHFMKKTALLIDINLPLMVLL